MLSAAGLSGGTISSDKANKFLAPPPSGGGKIRSPLPPPPNDPAVKRMTSSPGVGLKDVKEAVRRNADPLSDLSPLEVCISERVFFLHFQFFLCM